MANRKSILNQIDWLGVGLYLLLVLIGIATIYATEYKEGNGFSLFGGYNYSKQIIWAFISFFVAFIILVIDSKFYSSFAWVFYGFIMLLLVLVLFLGKNVNGSNSWFEIGSFRLQPAELGKFAAAIALSKYLSGFEVKFENLRSMLISGLIILVPMVLIFAQHDTGSMLVFCAFIFVFYREGLPGWILFGGIGLIILGVLALIINKFLLIGFLALLAALVIWLFRKELQAIVLAIVAFVTLSGVVFGVDFFVNKVLEPHQRNRINVILGKVKEKEMKTIAYNLYQSKIAIGAGGVMGKGYLHGLQTKGNFVPEMSTDFIFCSYAEEWGFLGCTLLLGIYLFLLIRLIARSEEQRSTFSRVFGYATASIFFFHFMINIGMTVGILPVIGIPLPFISYGGSSLLAFTILYFVFIKLDSERQAIHR